MKYLALFTLGCFCVLTSFAYGRAAPYQPIHTVVQRSRAEPVKLWKSGKSTELARKQAEALQKVYGFTPENMNAYKEWW